MTPSVENVLSVYRRSSAYSFMFGLEWYSAAHDFALSLDSNVERAAGIIAALSPMNGWNNNMNKAALLYRQNGDGTNVGLYRNVDKAIRIYNGADPLDVLGGDKVRAFYSTIVDPSGDNTPVIDRHAFDIAIGRVTNDAARSMLARKGMYELFAKSYIEAAHITGVSPAEMQAITWTQWREEKGIK